MNVPIKRALLSVSDKTGIVELAKYLQSLNIELLSTGGTAQLLKSHDIPVLEIATWTGFPEILGGRVKTLHPKIHGGILARIPIDNETVMKHSIPLIDLVIVNLYPFEETISHLETTLDDAIENIDIGGPSLLRAAAKNFQRVTVMTDPNDYLKLIDELSSKNGSTSIDTRFNLAKKAFVHTSRYDGIIANYLTATDLIGQKSEFPETYTIQLVKQQEMRYGENPHQKAAFYREDISTTGNITNAKQCQGKSLSFNNITDADCALECVKQFREHPACVIVKHANPCGAAVAPRQVDAYLKAFECDSVSAFGGIIAFNTELDATTAEVIIDKQFVEVIIAPDIDAKAASILSTKPNIRVLKCGSLNDLKTSYDYKRVVGGLLVQNWDHLPLNSDEITIATERHPSPQEMNDLIFAWRIAKFVKSNAIVFAKNGATLGIGAGQMSRVFSTQIAIQKAATANLDLQNAVMASDAFFPFCDSLDLAKESGIVAIIQPGGSINDKEIIAAANKMNMCMVLTHIRHFRH